MGSLTVRTVGSLKLTASLHLKNGMVGICPDLGFLPKNFQGQTLVLLVSPHTSFFWGGKWEGGETVLTSVGLGKQHAIKFEAMMTKRIPD